MHGNVWFETTRAIEAGDWVLTTYVTQAGKDPYCRLWPEEARNLPTQHLRATVISDAKLIAYVH